MSEFISSLGAFSDEEDPIDVVIFAVLAEEGFEVGDAHRIRASCNTALQTFPRRVPRDVYSLYSLVLKRVTYLCEALTIALTSNTSMDSFYIFKAA